MTATTSNTAARSALVAAGITNPGGRALYLVDTGTALGMRAGLSEQAARQLSVEFHMHYCGLRSYSVPPTDAGSSERAAQADRPATTEEQLAADIVSLFNATKET